LGRHAQGACPVLGALVSLPSLVVATVDEPATPNTAEG
jgi:hypothetical protein